MKRKFLILIFFKVSISLFSQSLEIPQITNPDAVIIKSFYALQYNEKFEQADWVAYELTKNEVLGTVTRTDNFKSDNAVTTIFKHFLRCKINSQFLLS